MTVREWACDIIKLKGVDGNGSLSFFGSDERCICPFTIQLKVVVCHPVFHVRTTATCGFQKSVEVSVLGGVKKLRVAGTEAVIPL